jgi:hypothetical protein
MNRLTLIGVLACILADTVAGQPVAGSSAAQPGTGTQVPKYFRANHGFDGGLVETVDLRKLEGFDDIRTIDQVARFASEVPGAVGFTAHPNFEHGDRYARAVLWYTKLSATGSSWTLYLFDKKEAQKRPGAAPRAGAVAAAEAKVSARMKEARDLIDGGGPNGVKLVGDYDEQRVLAHAVMRLGGSFVHTGRFAVGPCGSCRSVVPGGNPHSCGLGVQNKKHWTCCGSTNKTGHCQYWKLVNARDGLK